MPRRAGTLIAARHLLLPSTPPFLRAGALLVGLLGLTSCGRTEPAHRSTSAAPDTAALVREIPRFLRISGVPGLSMAVVRDGRLSQTFSLIAPQPARR